MRVIDAIRARRTIRFYQERTIPPEVLRELVDAARLAPSAANLQPLEYVVVSEPGLRARVFPTLAWAGYVRPRRDPPEGKRPVAYIIVLVNREIREASGRHDAGAAIENLLLAAWEKGLGGCWLGAVDRERLRSILELPEHLELDSVVALGYPAEQPVAEEMRDSVRYYLDESDVLHVPKRRLADILHENGYGRRGEASEHRK
jgi:nitroreductase